MPLYTHALNTRRAGVNNDLVVTNEHVSPTSAPPFIKQLHLELLSACSLIYSLITSRFWLHRAVHKMPVASDVLRMIVALSITSSGVIIVALVIEWCIQILKEITGPNSILESINLAAMMLRIAGTSIQLACLLMGPVPALLTLRHYAQRVPAPQLVLLITILIRTMESALAVFVLATLATILMAGVSERIDLLGLIAFLSLLITLGVLGMAYILLIIVWRKIVCLMEARHISMDAYSSSSNLQQQYQSLSGIEMVNRGYDSETD